jgi:RNA polymerase sigma-70 factor (ECF subfamily)
VSAGTPVRVTEAEPFEAFVRAHQDMVFATAVRLLGRAADAEDVSQDVFLKAFERFDVLGTSPAAAGWLRTVTRNACLNHLTRDRARWRLFSELPGADADRTPEEQVLALAGPAPSDTVDLEAQHQNLHDALLQLPDAQRVPLVLFHFESASYQEIADLLRVSLGKVKTDIHRGREALKKHLTHERSV